MYAVKGSSLLVNGVDNILLLQRNMDKMRGEYTKEQRDKMHDVEIIVEKQRATGWTDAIKLKYHPAKRTFSKM
jgi:replicative DNA helicase